MEPAAPQSLSPQSLSPQSLSPQSSSAQPRSDQTIAEQAPQAATNPAAPDRSPAAGAAADGQRSGTGSQGSDTAGPENPTAAPPARSPAGKIGALVLLVLLGTIGWQVATDLTAPSSSTGAVVAFTAQIAPRVAGQVVEIHVADNQRVAAGEPLFSLDPAPFDLAVRQAEAALEQALVAVAASTASLAGAEAQVDQARSAFESAQAQADRVRTLFDRGLGNEVAVNDAAAQVVSAQSSLEAAIAQMESARLQLGDGQGDTPQVATARVQLEQTQLNREFSVVRAPTDGVVTNLRMAPGQFIAAGSPAITFIESVEPWMVVDLRENQLANVAVGDTARVLFDAVPGRTFEARVRGIAWGIDTGRTAANGLPQNQASTRWFEPARTIPVQLELIDPTDWPANIRVGSKVTALIYSGNPNGVVARVATGLQWVRSYISYLY